MARSNQPMGSIVPSASMARTRARPWRMTRRVKSGLDMVQLAWGQQATGVKSHSRLLGPPLFQAVPSTLLLVCLAS